MRLIFLAVLLLTYKDNDKEKTVNVLQSFLTCSFVLKYIKTPLGDDDTEFGCAFGEGEIPVPIPNTEVKPFSGDGTAVLTVGE